MKPRLLVGLFLALAAGGAAIAQQGSQPPPVIFRAEVNYVELDAIVTDAQGNVVTGPEAPDDGRTSVVV